MSTRGTGAFSGAIRDVEIFLESLFDEVWIETAGSGQTQSEVARIAGFTVLILQPETGDEVQWMKSGVREWADFFLINKSDLGGAESVVESLKEFGTSPERIAVVSAKTGAGIEEALRQIRDERTGLDWKQKGPKLYEAHAFSLFEESYRRKLAADFKKRKKDWLRNPYAKLKSS